MAGGDRGPAEVADSTVRTVLWRLLPLLGVVYLIAYVDRQNVSFAKLQMAADIGLDEPSFGFGASLFFVGYFLFEVPSNLVLARVGAGVWFARIMASWGLVTVLLAFTPNGPAFYLLRFLLGVAEAGLFPGVLFTLTLWLPPDRRGPAIGLFMVAGAVANAIGSAIGGLLLDLDGVGGVRGWQWLFVATGLPAIALAPIVWRLLPVRPADATWLDSRQKEWLARETAVAGPAESVSLVDGLAALRDPRVALLCVTYFGFPLSAYGLSYWLPTIIRDLGASNVLNGALNALLWTMVALALWLAPRHAAGCEDKRPHLLGPPIIGAFALVASAVVTEPAARYVALCLAAAAIYAGQPVFWTLPSRFMTGPRAAAGLAAINSVGNLGGFVAQATVPKVATVYASPMAPMLPLAGGLVLAALGAWVSERRLARVRDARWDTRGSQDDIPPPS